MHNFIYKNDCKTLPKILLLLIIIIVNTKDKYKLYKYV